MIQLLSRFFLQPGMLAFSALVAIPIIIYLIHRQRFQRRRWAAMEFLLRAVRKSRRRLQIQNLLLLLIRVAILLLLAVAMARPVLREAPLGITAGTNENWIFVIDTSYSMGYRDGPDRLFDQAREAMIRLVEEVLEDGDGVALVTIAESPEVLLARSVVGDDIRRRLVDTLERDVRLTALPARIVPSLRVLDDVVRQYQTPTGEPEPCRIVLFSDLQARDWVTPAGDEPRSPEAREILRGIRERGGELAVARWGDDTRKLNVVVSSLSIRPRLVAQDVPVTIRVTVENPSTRDADNLDLTLSVAAAEDVATEESGPSSALLGEVLRLPAGGSVTRSLPYRFDRPGQYAITAEIRSDGLVTDNRRHLVVEVREDIEILMVDGEPAIDTVERETFFLETALRPGEGDDDLAPRFSPFLPEYLTTDQLADIDWDRYSAAILANVDDVGAQAMLRLRRFVAEGGALMVFLGGNVDADRYNELFASEEEPLLPGRLREVRGDRETPVFIQFDDPSHPVARFFGEHEDRSYLAEAIVSFYRYFRLEPDEGRADLRVLARFNDLDGSPAIVDASHGQGRVLWFLSSADREWNDFAVWQDYVVFVHESLSYLLGFGARSRNLPVGAPFVGFWPSDEFASEVLLHTPPEEEEDLGTGVQPRLAMRELPGGGRFRVVFEATDVPGVYRLDLRRPRSSLEDSSEAFAVNVDPGEGDLRPVTADDFERALGVTAAPFDVDERFRSLESQPGAARGQEYWRGVMWVVLGLLVAETILAWLFGRRADRSGRNAS